MGRKITFFTPCPTCDTDMEKKLDVDDLILYWCPTCGTTILYAPDLEDHKAVWIPLREGLVPLTTRQQSKEQSQ